MKQFIDKLIERLEEESKDAQENMVKSTSNSVANFCSGACGAYNKTIAIVNQLAEEYNNGWIACSERLPDAEADVLLSLRSLDIYTGFRANTEGMFYVEGEGYVEYENVLAWQPLPEPYKPKGE